MKTNRREFLLRSAAAGVGQALTSAGRGQAASGSAPTTSGLPADWRTQKKLDAHNHVFGLGLRPNSNWAEVENLVEACEALGIAKVYCSRPATYGAMADMEVVRESNNAVLAAMKRYPQTIAGYCFVQPGNGAPMLDEIERCLEAGMIGVKLYNQFKFTDPVVFPIAEKCIERGIPFLGHSGFLTDPKALAAQPGTSHALDFCALSRRYPELILILGHINGGGDWEWAIKGLRECSNVYLDTSGSVLESPTIELALRALGVDRLIFATDATMEGCVGKIFGAELTAAQREAIFWRNFQKILDRRRA